MNFARLAALGLLIALPGCVHRQPNPPLDQTRLDRGYYFHTHHRPHNSPDTLFLLCFSGGGTRAAAMSYGVLEALRDIPIERPGSRHRLLDEVDAISSVSGGSITAAAYALLGDEIFTRLESDFLHRDIQSQLLWRTLNPFRWCKLWSKTYGRSELAADLYDEVLFRGATFGDLTSRPGAYVVINATDISSGTRFGFTQYQFDLLCSDLASIRLSHAVAASSAVPGLLSPITINNYAGRCRSDIADAVREAASATARGIGSRARYHYAEMASYLDSTNHPYIHLVDGGVADNLGVRAVLDGIYSVESHPAIERRYDLQAIDKVAILVVNAYSKPETGWSKREIAPGTLELAVAGATIPMDRYSYETVELLKEQVERWKSLQARQDRSGASARRAIRFYPIILDFNALTNATERSFFMNQRTSFALSHESVDRLRLVGGELTRQSPVFHQFLADLAGSPPAAR